jgi:hypothetical protein
LTQGQRQVTGMVGALARERAEGRRRTQFEEAVLLCWAAKDRRALADRFRAQVAAAVANPSARLTVPTMERRLRAGERIAPGQWRRAKGRTPLKSVRLCETGTGWLVSAPASPRGPHDVSVSRLHCWSPSCRICGPHVGRQDLARLEPAITGRRWLYAVCTLGPNELRAGARAARARRAEAFAEWRALVVEQIGPPGSAAFQEAARERGFLERWDPFGDEQLAREAAGRRKRQLDINQQWFEVARTVKKPPTGWKVSEDPYHVADFAWRERLKRTLRTAFGTFDYVVTWEAQREGRPHLNLLADATAFGEHLEPSKLKAGDIEGRPTMYPPALRRWFNDAAIAAGFGLKFHLELCEPGGPGLAFYVAKLSRELICPTVKGQAPHARPARFRRYNTSQDLLEPRIFPRAQPARGCPEPGCDEPPPRGAWCKRTLGHHLRTVHGYNRSAAAALVAGELEPTDVGRAAILEADAPLDADVAAIVRRWATTEAEARTWYPIAQEIETGRAKPTRVALESHP